MKTLDKRECRHARHMLNQCLPAATSAGMTTTVPIAIATGTIHVGVVALLNPYPVVLLATLELTLSAPAAL